MTYKIVCAACQQHLGDGDEAKAEELGIEHAYLCTATAEEHREAVTRVKFQQIVQELDFE